MRTGAPHAGSAPSSRHRGSYHCHSNRRPGRRTGVRTRFTVRQANITAGVGQRCQVPDALPLPALAASAGISVSQLQAGLAAAKQAGGNTGAGITAFAASTGVSQATAQRVIDAVFGTEVGKQPGKQPGQQPSQADQQAWVSALAAQLGVSHSAAQRAVNQLAGLGRGGIDPASPAFAAIAHQLGVSPDRLVAALQAAKQSMAGR